MRQATDNTHDSSTLPLRLMKQHSISFRMIGRATDNHEKTVIKVLDPERFNSVALGRVRAIRSKIEEALALFGHEFAPGELWKEYDQVEEAA